MGISVRVVVEPKWISKQAWRRVYAESVTILRAWPNPPMRFADRMVAGVKVVSRTRKVIDNGGWGVCGDARSRQYAEESELPSELGVEHPLVPNTEIIVREFDADHDRSLERLLGNKTQGLPIHTLIVAVAMLIEHRFPQAAVVLGDLDRHDARQAQRELDLILGERISLPVCVDAQRMRARLEPHYEGPELDRALHFALAPYFDARDRISNTLALAYPPPPTTREELRSAMICTEVVELSKRTRRMFEEFAIEVDATARQAGLSALHEHADADQLLGAIADGARASRLCLTDMAWDELPHASLAELRYLAALAWMSPVNLGIEIKPAVFESAAVRRLCVETCVAKAAAEASDLRAKHKPNEFVLATAH